MSMVNRNCRKKLKARKALNGSYMTSYGITQCYLLPDTRENMHRLNPSRQAGTPCTVLPAT